jgi:hypothetical protein
MVENKNTFIVWYVYVCGAIRYISGASGKNLITNNNINLITAASKF